MSKMNEEIVSALPEWYWQKGLHEAKIVDIEEQELAYDYKQRDPVRNCIVLHLDSRMALFDSSVKEIKLYNYKLCSPEAAVQDLCGTWWLKDNLSITDTGYSLAITLKRIGKRASREELVVEIQFKYAEVIKDR